VSAFITFHSDSLDSTQLNVIGSAQYWRCVWCQWQRMATKWPRKEMSRWQGPGLAASTPTVVLSLDLLKSPKRLSIANVITWLSLPTFLCTKWLGDWRGLKEGTLAGESYQLEGGVSGDRYMSLFTSGFSILVLPISLQLRMHTSEAKKNVESYEHMWHCFVYSFFIHLTMLFPVHRLYNNEWKITLCVCVCVFF
jgi:hypothetical protein